MQKPAFTSKINENETRCVSVSDMSDWFSRNIMIKLNILITFYMEMDTQCLLEQNYVNKFLFQMGDFAATPWVGWVSETGVVGGEFFLSLSSSSRKGF